MMGTRGIIYFEGNVYINDVYGYQHIVVYIDNIVKPREYSISTVVYP
jgi:hypothetical protein